MQVNQQTKTDFFCQFNRGCAFQCALCPHRGSGRKEILIGFTLEEIRALTNGSINSSIRQTRIYASSALEKLEQAYKNNRQK